MLRTSFRVSGGVPLGSHLTRPRPSPRRGTRGTGVKSLGHPSRLATPVRDAQGCARLWIPPANAMLRRHLPRTSRGEMPFLSASEVATVAEAVPPPHDDLVYTLTYGGPALGGGGGTPALAVPPRPVASKGSGILRRGGRKLVLQGPPRQRRTAVITVPPRESCRASCSGRGPRPRLRVFTNGESGPLRDSNFRSPMWPPSLATAGLPEGLGIHDLRHTCAALLRPWRPPPS
jgi:hypothetical protein